MRETGRRSVPLRCWNFGWSPWRPNRRRCGGEPRSTYVRRRMIDDEVAIRELIAGYALALDGGDVDGCVQLFTADAVYLVYGRSFAGHDGIAKMFREAPRGLHLTG